jgi:hypothetical protein
MSEHTPPPDTSADQERGRVEGPVNGLPQSLAAGEWDIFISYSRKDQQFATRLHAALNAYQPPRGLPLPPRRLQAFIDTSDFSGPDYRPAIRRHLGNSAKIIVICSPNAVASRFVGPEIDDFVALHPVAQQQSTPSELDPATRGDIIPIIIDGLPINETTGVSDPQNAFPEALCRALTLPIAVDYRGFETRQHKLGEGQFHNPWFTLLADIYVHERAAIEERERKRRVRTLRIRSSIVAAVAVGLISLSIWALSERSTAIDQRTRAYARQQAARAQTGLSDALAPGAPAVRNALASVSLEPNREAVEALQAGIKRLPPLWLGQLPVDQEDGIPQALKFSANGEFLLGVTDKLVLLWRTANRAAAVRYPIQGAASIIGFGSDGAHAALSVKSDKGASEPSRLLVIELAARKVVERSYARILDAAMTPSGLRALVAEADGRRLRVVDPVSDRIIREIALNNSAKIARLSLRDAGVFLADDGNEAWAYPDGTGEPVRYRLPKGAAALDFGVHSGLLALKTAPRGANSRGILIVDIATGKPVIDVEGASATRFIGFTGADRFVLLSGTQGTDWYNATDGKRVLTIESSRAIDYNLTALTDAARQIPVIDAASTEDGQLLITALKDGRVTAWYPGSRPRNGTFGAMPMPDLEPVARFDHGETLGATATWSTIPALFVSPDGQYVATQSDGMKTNAVGGLTSFKPMVRIWDVRHRTEIARFTPRLGMAVFFNPATDLIATLQRSPDQKATPPVQLDLWRLSSGNAAVERTPTESADFLPKQDKSGLKLYSIAASADGRRLVWLSTDGELRMRRAESGQIETIDHLRPIAKHVFAELAGSWQQRLKSSDPRARERFSSSEGPIDPFTRLDTLLKETSARGAGPHLPDQNVPILPIAVSGNGCCLLVAIGPMLRLYDLDARRVVAERTVSDMMIQPLGLGGVPQDLVISYDGRAFATSIVTLAAFEAEAIAQSERQEKGDREPPALKGEIRGFTADADSVGTLEQRLLLLPVVGAWLPLDRPLAIDAHSRQIAIDRITQEVGKPNGTRRIAVINLTDTANSVMETTAEDWEFNPMQMLLGPGRSATLRAAFSPDDQYLLTVETKPTCAGIVQTSQALLPTMVPYCAQQTSEAQIWRVTTGARIAANSFEVVTGDKPVGRQVIGLGLSDEHTIAQTALESTPEDESRPRTIVRERVSVEDSRLIDEACARLPNDERSFSYEDWAHNFPGEPYRAICKSPQR